MDYKLTKTADGSNTLFSKEYNQHYHNIDDGAIVESLHKHIIPAFKHQKEKDELVILDICFGIGYNTLATLYYLKKENLKKKIKIYSPELDANLISTLKNFEYPDVFCEFRNIIIELSNNHKYQDENLYIEIIVGNARDYLKTCEINFDIIYQDAFSSDVNKELWTYEYFKELYRLLDNQGIVTTYAIATPVRLSMSENGFYIYQYKPTKRKSTLAFKTLQNIEGFVDMELKKIRNKEARAYYD